MEQSTPVILLLILLTLLFIVTLFIKYFFSEQHNNIWSSGIFNFSKKGLGYNYKPKKHLLTKHELQFYKKLQQEIIDPNLVVLAKVRLADIIEPAELGKSWYGAFNKIKSKHIDFVLCNKETSEIVKCIELNDSSHSLEKRIQRDKLVRDIMEQCKVPLEYI